MGGRKDSRPEQMESSLNSYKHDFLFFSFLHHLFLIMAKPAVWRWRSAANFFCCGDWSECEFCWSSCGDVASHVAGGAPAFVAFVFAMFLSPGAQNVGNVGVYFRGSLR